MLYHERMLEKPIFEIPKKLYGYLNTAGAGFSHVFLLLFRLNFGIQLFNIGLEKLNNHAKVAEFFASIGIPLADLNAWFVGGVEMLGGLCLALGLLSRPWAVMIAGAMSVAYMTAPDDRATVLVFFENQSKFLQSDPFFYLLLALLILSFGPGKLSLDFLVQKFVLKNETKNTTKTD